MAMDCFFSTDQNANLSNLVLNFQIDRHRGGIIVPFPSGFIKNLGILAFYDLIRLADYQPVLCQPALRGLEEANHSHYEGRYPAFFD